MNQLSGVIPLAIFNMSALRNIALTRNELSGSLPAELCHNLPFLQGLYLGGNHLSGQIPSNLSHCKQLQTLSLFRNSFTGNLPNEICGNLGVIITLEYNQLGGQILSNFSHCNRLYALSLSGNSFTGILPNDLCTNLPFLQVILLDNNQFSGQIPSNLSHCSQLLTLQLAFNNFNGAIPPEIGQLHQLKVLNLAGNTLSGTIPPEVYNISTLRNFSLGGNALSGGLPNNMCDELHVLQVHVLGVNTLSGLIPDSISNCSNLRMIDLPFNKFTGFIPHALGKLRLLETLSLGGNNLRSSESMSFLISLTNCTSLRILEIGENPLDAVIPASIGNLSSSLQVFAIKNCNMRGIIPAGIGNLKSLVTLVLANNELSGKIPLTVEHLHKLQGIYLRNNNMTGSIVESLCELPSLVRISLSQNPLSGSVPQCLGNVSSLRVIYLDSNKLSSSIPSSLWHLKDLLRLDLSSNTFTGFLPPEIGNLKVAIHINLSRNQLSDSIPATIGILKNLIYLSLAHNTLSGPFPVSVGSMISLVTLDFSNNNLSGSIPKSLETLNYLIYFDVSFNDLNGEIPTGGPFRNFTMESFKGNEALCGIPRFHVPICPTVSNHRSKRKKVELALSIVLAFIFVRYKRQVKTTTRVDGIMISNVPERISYYELLQATQQFNDSNLLGTGSSCSVYKGILRDGKIIATKVFDMQLEGILRRFEVECEILRSIRHRNLTNVISSCSNEEFRALVLEYMPKGNLEKWLYSHNYCLNAMERLNIMIDVASAMEYLHHGYSTPIVHSDLKPNNVLIDEDMVAHVSDFGIAKLLGNGDSFVLANTLATLGYIAPEYGLEGLVSTRCDVYSYGVMLMETFSRKRPSDDMFGGDLSLKSWVETSLPQMPDQVIDANLLMNLGKKHFDNNFQCISSILELALKCSAETPGNRINMKEALAELQKIKSRFSTNLLQAFQVSSV